MCTLFFAVYYVAVMLPCCCVYGLMTILVRDSRRQTSISIQVQKCIFNDAYGLANRLQWLSEMSAHVRSDLPPYSVVCIRISLSVFN